MLTKKQYKALRKYRDSAIPAQQTLDETTAYLLERKFIVPKTVEYTVHMECDVTYHKNMWLLSMQGKLALEEFEEYRTQRRENRIWQIVGVIIGLLALAATIFGILQKSHQ